MLQFLSENIATIALTLGLCVLVGAIIAYLVHEKKAGKTSCGCGCGTCAMRDKCHKK